VTLDVCIIPKAQKKTSPVIVLSTTLPFCVIGT
jgi:hypothetical protein